MKILFKQIYIDQNFYFKDFFETGKKTIKGTYLCKKISEEKAVGLYFFPDRGKPFELENEFFSPKLELGLNSIPEKVNVDIIKELKGYYIPSKFLEKAKEDDFERIENDLYVFDPKNELGITLGNNGTGWVCLWEDYF